MARLVTTVKTDKGGEIKWASRPRGSTSEILRSLEAMGQTKVLGAPRLLVINKQLAVVHLGDLLTYRTTNRVNGALVETTNTIPLGTQLKVRPLVTAEAKVRVEVTAQRTSGHLDSQDIPQTDTTCVRTNLLMRDGATIAISSGPKPNSNGTSARCRC